MNKALTSLISALMGLTKDYALPSRKLLLRDWVSMLTAFGHKNSRNKDCDQIIALPPDIYKMTLYSMVENTSWTLRGKLAKRYPLHQLGDQALNA